MRSARRIVGNLTRPYVCVDYLATEVRIGHEERDIRVVETPAAVLSNLLAAPREDDAPVRLDEHVGRTSRSHFVAGGRITKEIGELGSEVDAGAEDRAGWQRVGEHGRWLAGAVSCAITLAIFEGAWFWSHTMPTSSVWR